MPPQQVTIGPALMEGGERTNAVVVRGQKQKMGAPRRDPYAMEIDRGKNCYTCRGFGYIVCHYRNRGGKRTVKGRRVEYGGGRFEGNIEQIGHLKEVENLEALN